MYYYEVAPNKIVRSDTDTFTYASVERLSPGGIVEIEIGKQKAVGIVLEEVAKPAYPTKPIIRLLETEPLPARLVVATEWLSRYYATPLATVLQTVLPRGLAKKRREKHSNTSVHLRKRTNFVFTADQSAAISAIKEMANGTALLHGVTGSGKTAVYIEIAKRTLAAKKSVVILVPEIALTSQLVAEFSQHFDTILLTHSAQTEAERHLVWREALTSETPRIIIGPRSALFLPVRDLGLIVIDECHEPSFHQEKSPRYNALRLASFFTEQTGGKLLLGSATPLVSDYYLAEIAHRPILRLPTPAQKNTVKPTVAIIDMTKRGFFRRHRFLSDSLLAQLEATFARGEQALIFHNRRGSASTSLCENCGWQAGCPRCYVPLTLHADRHHLRCHICGLTTKVPTTCPDCDHTDIIHKGIGTKLIESELRKLFPKTTMARFDGDSASGETLEKRYSELYSGKIQLIIGTQVIAKGLDLPHLRTVGVVQADAGLSLPDFSAPERTFQLLAQVVGRVGRSHHPTTVIVQSYQPSHPAVVDGVAQNYAEFYERTRALREATNFPPFVFLLKLTCVYKTEAVAIKNAQKLAETLRHKTTDIEILGPTPAFYERAGDTYRWQLVLKSKTRADLLAALAHVPPKNWQFELDPISLL